MKTSITTLHTLLVAALMLLPQAGQAQEISESAKQQIEALLAEKESRSPAERKMDSQLIYLAAQEQGLPVANGVLSLDLALEVDADNRVLVDIAGTVSAALTDAITQAGGEVVNQFAPFGAIRARVPVSDVESLAGRADVSSIGPAAEAITNVGSALSQGDRTHRADTARVNTRATGSGIKIGVLSDGVNSLAKSKLNGNLNASASFLPGQAGSGDEGTAMMELIQDLVPDAQLIFATAFGGNASFANNILALQAAGCSIIVDDVTYFNESPFQDQIISQAVNTVSAAGVLFFSSAGNSGNKNDNTSGTWEGDFVSGGAVAAPVTGTGNLLNFGGGTTFNTVAAGGNSRRVDLFWADPDLASTNDYDLFVLDSAGTTVLRSSTNLQTGTQSPYEAVNTLNVGERIVVVQRPGAANRFLQLTTGRAVLTLSTNGVIRGHNASGAANAFCVAATNVANSPSPNFFVGGATNPVETFSSDGPRRIFFQPDGSPITPGDFSSAGGQVLAKPDITAADGTTTSVAGFTTFFGTSAAAPHAAAIAALLKSYNASLTPAQIRTAMTSTALDIEAPGNDRDSGAGIVMALAAINSVPAPNSVISGTPLFSSQGLVGGPFAPGATTYTVTNSSASSLNWTAVKTQPWITLSSGGGTLAPGETASVTCSFNAAADALALGSYSDVVTITDTTSGLTRNFNVSLSVVASLPDVVLTALPNDGSFSGNARAPMTRHRFARSVYLIKASELAASGYKNGTVPNSIGWSYRTAPGLAGSAPLKVYLQNTADTTNTKSTDWSTAITGMTTVHDATTNLPNVTGPFDVSFAGGSSFTYTGGGLYVAFDWGQYSGTLSTLAEAHCNSTGLVNGLLGAQNNVSAPTILVASSFRPETRLSQSINNDVAVSFIYALGEAPLGFASALTIQAVITNTGGLPVSNLPVTLTVTGANPFTDTQTIPLLAGLGDQTVVTFRDYAPSVLGGDTLQVSIPNDENVGNNNLSKTRNITSLSYSYKHPGSTANGGVGFNSGTGALVNKFTVPEANAVTDVRLEFNLVTATTYRVAIYGDSGLGRPSTVPLYVDAADRTVSAAGPVTITLPSPVAVAAGSFYVGIQQTNTVNASVSFDNETPIRSGTFFFASPNPPASWTDFAPANSFKINLGLNFQNPILAEVAVYDGSGTGGAVRTDNAGTAAFGGINLGSSSTTQTYTVQNTGGVNLTGIAVTQTGSSDFVLNTAGTAATLAPGATTSFTVTFTPSSTGAKAGVINIASSDADENPFEINLGGTGVGIPEIAVFDGNGTGGAQRTDNTGTQDFATVNVGSSSAVQTFTIQNTGTGNLTLGTVSLGGADPGQFSVTQPLSTTLIPNATTTFTATFSPTTAGGKSAVVNIASNDTDENPFEINVSGTGVVVSPLSVAPKAGLSLPFLDSGSIVFFDEIAFNSTVHGQTIKGFTFSENIPNALATNGGPNNTNSITAPYALSGGGYNPATYAMTITMPGVVTRFGFDFAIAVQAVTANAVTIELFNGATSLGSLTYGGALDPSFAGGFAGIQSTVGFTSARITFGPTAAAFAIDNVGAFRGTVFTGVPITIQSGDFQAGGNDLPTRELANFTPTPGTGYTYIEITGAANSIIGTFNDLPQGGVVAMNLNGVIYYFQANYNGGVDGNDLVLTNFTPSGPPAWKHQAGPVARNAVAIFGTKGTGADANNPGARQGAMNWLDDDGDLWMLGGYGYAQSVTNPPRYLNDLWRYDRSAGQWIWVSGANVHNQFGNYTDAILANRTPGSRHTGTTWKDTDGDLWLFGGYGIGTTPGVGRLNDLWRFDTGTLLWTHMKGSNVTGAAGVYGAADAPGNTPGARQGATGWATPGFLWLFGGTTDGGTTHHNDLWRYSIASGNWTVIKGNATTNVNGTYAGAPAANTPGARRDATGWVAKDNKLWLFGGSGLAATGTTLGDMSDLWSFDPVTGNWTHISGPTTQGSTGTYTALNAAGTPAARSAGSGWVTVDGDLWLVGGFKDSNQSYNDVWIYDIGTGVWTWKLGSSSTNAAGSYGVGSDAPGARFTPSTWVTLNGTLWIFGGGGVDVFGNTGRLSDLWSYGIPNPVGAPWDEAQPEPFPAELIVNADPNTSDASAGTMAYVPVSGQLTGSDADGDKLLFSATGSTLSRGTLTLNADGIWTYTPAPGFTGSTAFQFKASDNYGGESAVRTLVITVSTNLADSDGDGIADGYEYEQWGSLASADGDGDADLDGQSNYFEFLAGTDPLDAGERLATAPSIASSSANGTIKLQLTHVRPGVNYHLETSSDLDEWTRLGTFTFSVAGSAEIEDPTPATSAPKFYRMNLEATPAVILP